MTHFIEAQNAEMVFTSRKGRFHALREIHLTVAKGEFVTLIGHSGCGKSTLLNLIAGLTLPTSGVLLCDNREIAAPGPERAVVFQNHSLLPWLTCFDNVYLAVERVFGASEPKARLKERTAAALALVGMGHALLGAALAAPFGWYGLGAALALALAYWLAKERGDLRRGGEWRDRRRGRGAKRAGWLYLVDGQYQHTRHQSVDNGQAELQPLH
jgi:ABC-type glutathione transport system ATPase component